MAGFKDTLKEAVRQMAFRTSVDKLKKQGVQNVNVLGIDRISALVEAAVYRSLKSRLVGGERDAVAESTKAEFLRLLRTNEDLRREKSEVEKARERAEEEIDIMRRELSQTTRTLAQRLEVGELEGANRYEGEDADIAARVAEAVALTVGGDNQGELKERMTALVMHIVSGERREADAARKALQDREVENLQRRVKKLTQTLEATEARLSQASVEPAIEKGISSIYREVQGLDATDTQAQKKKELMAGIFEANLKLMKRSRRA